jgi:hypothetical protein
MTVKILDIKEVLYSHYFLEILLASFLKKCNKPKGIKSNQHSV